MNNRKRIAIITFHNAMNCGALLQAYALQHVIRCMGYDVVFPDCNTVGVYGGHFKRISPVDSSLMGLVRHYIWWFCSGVLSIGVDEVWKLRFESCRQKWLCRVACSKDQVVQHADIIVFGSDQIWNDNLTSWESDYFRGKTISAEVPKIAYAASVGDDIRAGLGLSRVLSMFSAVSVRENLALGLKQVLDPSLLIGIPEYDSIAYSKRLVRGSYLLLFTISGRHEQLDAARAVANLTGRELVVVNMAQKGFWRWKKGIKLAVSPDRFVAYVRDADYVLTDSFHGTALSLVYHRAFLSFVQKVPSGRIYSLLAAIGLEGRMVSAKDSAAHMLDILLKPLSEEVYSKLMSLKTDSISWLKRAVDNANK